MTNSNFRQASSIVLLEIKFAVFPLDSKLAWLFLHLQKLMLPIQNSVQTFSSV